MSIALRKLQNVVFAEANPTPLQYKKPALEEIGEKPVQNDTDNIVLKVKTRKA